MTTLLLALLTLLLPVAAFTGWWAARRDMEKRNAQQIPGHYLKGINYLLNEQSDKAMDLFLNAADLDADAVETYIIIGNMMRRRGEVERAIRLHQSLIARPGLNLETRSDALLELARDYLRSGLFDRARNTLQNVLEGNFHKIEALRHLCEISEQEKEWEEAIRYARRIERAGGGDQQGVIAQYYCELGEQAQEAGDETKASQNARRALRHNAACARAHILLGELASHGRDYPATVHHYREAYRHRPEFAPLILDRLRAAYEAQGDRKGFRQFLHKARLQPQALLPALSLVESTSQDKDPSISEVFASTFESHPSSLVLLREYVEAILDNRIACDRESLRRIQETLDFYLADRPMYHCEHCGFKVRRALWQCPSCQHWDTLQYIEPYAEKPRKKPYLV